MRVFYRKAKLVDTTKIKDTRDILVHEAPRKDKSTPFRFSTFKKRIIALRIHGSGIDSKCGVEGFQPIFENDEKGAIYGNKGKNENFFCHVLMEGLNQIKIKKNENYLNYINEMHFRSKDDAQYIATWK